MSPAKSKVGSAIGAFFGFTGLSVLAGLMVATMLAPAIAVTGLAANSTISIFDSLPDYLRIDELAQSTTIMAKKGDDWVELTNYYDQNRVEIDADEMGDLVRQAAVAGEDRRFFEHSGVDLIGLARAVVGNVTGKSFTGASTLTMQLVRNHLVLQAEAAGDKEAIAAAKETEGMEGIKRKLEEIKMAAALERRYTKEEILTGYLNIASYGGQVYGIQAAAQRYYGVDAKDLTAAQAASLVAIVQSPNLRRLDQPDDELNGEANGYARNLERRNYILDHMYGEGYLDQEEYLEAVNSPIEPKITATPNGCYAAEIGQYFCDYVMHELKNKLVFSEDPAENAELIKRGGYTIYTTLDLDMQKVAEKAIKKYAPADFPRAKLGGTATSIETTTGRVLVMAQNTEYDPTDGGNKKGRSSVNFAAPYEYGNARGFQTGSVYKIFTLLAWLDAGHSVNEVLNTAIPRNGYRLSDFTVCGEPYNSNDHWPMRNDRAFPGSMNVINATVNSVNSGFADMALKLDLCDIRDMALNTGVVQAEHKELNTNPATIIGSESVAPMSLASSMGTIANKGIYCQPIVIDRIVDRNDKELPVPEADCTQAISPGVAAAAAYTLTQSMNSYPGRPRTSAPTIGKTGTSTDVVQNWLVGSSSNVATSVWVGNISGHVRLLGQWYKGVHIQQGPQNVFRELQTALNETYGGSAFDRAPEDLLKVRKITVPNLTGMTESQAKDLLDSLGFNVRVGKDIPWNTPAGTVGKQSPEAGSSATLGSTITIQLSTGEGREFPDVRGMDENEAQQAITGAGFIIGDFSIKKDWSDTVEEGKVISSNPSSGILAPEIDRVTLVVSRGPKDNPGPPPGQGDGPPGNSDGGDGSDGD